MPVTISSPRFSFVQFGEVSTVGSGCNFNLPMPCLPVYDEGDVYFQFIVDTDTTEEGDALCGLTDAGVTVGAVTDCDNAGFDVEFAGSATRFRLSPTKILYNWENGLPGLFDVIAITDCFHIKVDIDGTEACSNCFQRIGDPCHTSVIEYSNDDDAFGFGYCGAGAVDVPDPAITCDELIIPFIDLLNIAIPWTAQRVAQFGTAPIVQTWLQNGNGTFTRAIIEEKYDTFPPTEIRIDFGGTSSGYVKIK